jgi:hypothetical protein
MRRASSSYLEALRSREAVCVQRLRLLSLRSRAAACFRGAVAFFAEPFRAGAAAEAVRFAVLAAGLALAGARRFSPARFSTLGAATLLAAAFRAAGRALEAASAEVVTFSGDLDGAVFVGLKTSLLVLTATL